MIDFVVYSLLHTFFVSFSSLDGENLSLNPKIFIDETFSLRFSWNIFISSLAAAEVEEQVGARAENEVI